MDFIYFELDSLGAGNNETVVKRKMCDESKFTLLLQGETQHEQYPQY